MAYTTIKKPSDYFNTVLYTGNGLGTRAVTGVGFQPDLVWIKQRSDNSSNVLFDVIRGVTKYVKSDSTAIEATAANSLKAFGGDGFTISDSEDVGKNNGTYASWNWKANGTGVANTDGSISSTVSANTTSGFSIVSYTGTGADDTVGHGLGVAPKMIITKARGTTNNWGIYHESLGNNDAVFLNLTNGTNDYAGYWNTTTPTSSVFSVGVSPDTNSSATMIAYCFANVQGYSKFGSYIGNGSATDGTFCYTGFKPSYVIIKQTNTVGESWVIKDNKRGAFNQNNPTLFANLNSAESNREYIDFLSNGFKCRDNSSAFNASGSSYIYMAFAEAPLVGPNNTPCTAR